MRKFFLVEIKSSSIFFYFTKKKIQEKKKKRKIKKKKLRMKETVDFYGFSVIEFGKNPSDWNTITGNMNTDMTFPR